MDAFWDPVLPTSWSKHTHIQALHFSNSTKHPRVCIILEVLENKGVLNTPTTNFTESKTVLTKITSLKSVICPNFLFKKRVLWQLLVFCDVHDSLQRCNLTGYTMVFNCSHPELIIVMISVLCRLLLWDRVISSLLMSMQVRTKDILYSLIHWTISYNSCLLSLTQHSHNARILNNQYFLLWWLYSYSVSD